MSILKTSVNREWWWKTLLIILGMAFLARLGFWQLDRLEQRRDFNTRLAARWNQEPFDVNHEQLPANSEEMEWRRVKVEGEFDYANQIALINQPFDDGTPGVILVTPMVMSQGGAVLVARGWIPYSDARPEQWSKFDEPSGMSVVGLIQESQTLPGVAATEQAKREWFRIDIPAIQEQMPYELLPVFILQLPEPGRTINDYPLRQVPEYIAQPSEGSHLGYAVQWFLFSIILGFVYLQIIRMQELRKQRATSKEEDSVEIGELATESNP